MARSAKVFLLALTFLAAGIFLLGVSFIIEAIGSINGYTPGFGGLILVVLGRVLAPGQLD